MNIDRIKYTDFISKENYCELQEYFGRYDYKSEYSEIKEPLEDFKIIFKDYDEFEIEDYLEKEFLKDFLKPGISKMNDRYFANFKETMERKAILTVEMRGEFLKLYRTKIQIFRDKTLANKSLNRRIMDSLQLSLNELEELLIEYIKDPYPEIKTKIQFNWSRTEIEYFFYLLRANGEINDIKDNELGKIIDSTIEYWDGFEYKPIRLSRKHLNDFEREALRPVTLVNDRLTEVFKDFFHR